MKSDVFSCFWLFSIGKKNKIFLFVNKKDWKSSWKACKWRAKIWKVLAKHNNWVETMHDCQKGTWHTHPKAWVQIQFWILACCLLKCFFVSNLSPAFAKCPHHWLLSPFAWVANFAFLAQFWNRLTAKQARHGGQKSNKWLICRLQDCLKSTCSIWIHRSNCADLKTKSQLFFPRLSGFMARF